MRVSLYAVAGIVLLLVIGFAAYMIYHGSTVDSGPISFCTTVGALGFDGKSGVVLPLHACSVSCPHPGVYVGVSSVYGIPFQQAVRSALAAYERLHGDVDRCVFLSVKSPDLLTGESVGLAAYLAIWAALNHVDLSKYAATGVVNPDGSVSSVLYVPQKISAANGAKLTVFVPIANCPVSRGDNVLCVGSVSDAERVLTSSSAGR